MSAKISFGYRIKIILTFSFLFAFGYGFTNRFPVFTPKTLPICWVDTFLGFHPWTIWIYISDYLLIFLPAILISDISAMKRLIKGFLVDFAVHFPIFFFFPTTMIRPTLPKDGFINWVFHLEWLLDTPVNCFPSQHVSLCFVVAMGFWNYQRKTSILFFIWSILISISTMTTKQHYFSDVIGGMLVALIVYLLVYQRKREPHITLVSPNK
ncbi:MAG: hypothetical protein A2Z91_04445 [Deltaproteobacteria bacterium GWA2_38_16]|nr:MAG: hypothetical protein A2Z91_04445 [Deltaproteobacteria bacterium GWA2_38_16]OGQ01747.1 MAG: hypothetical protein A3D19_07735 [Deltaproteobacteria bacterium RIFCSPHIGHO2_02_FULL_38_15]OGQ33428.1 MAG: hypothetical protein A3A72_00605 [Deltaproteobacteria bacterium RIFCSPLOWO2_01_FULL_38_9]